MGDFWLVLIERFMDFFKRKQIFLDSESVAEQLRSARQRKNFKLEEIAKKLNINYEYLKALERGEYEKLPEGLYGKNFLREYCIFLGLDYDDLVKIYLEEKNLSSQEERKNLFSKQVAKNRYFWAMPKVVRGVIIAIIISACFIYLGFRLNKIISPPILQVYQPPEFFNTKDYWVKVQGKTEKEAKVTINNESILSDGQGNFSLIVNLKNGLNTITITAYKKYSKSSTITRQILVKD